MTARERILARVRNALVDRDERGHPGSFLGWRPGHEGAGSDDAFARRVTEAGGEVVRVSSRDEARSWLTTTAEAAGPVALGATLPPQLHPDASTAPAQSAAMGVSLARGAVAETGSVILDARDGRRAQLLPPFHVMIVAVEDIHATLADALRSLLGDLPSAVGLHSGPSKSADIGQVLVRGVHGPGRVVVLLVGTRPD